MMLRLNPTALHLVCIGFLLASVAQTQPSQTSNAPEESAAVTPGSTFNIWLGVAPGSEGWEQREYLVERPTGGNAVYNIVTPTLTSYLPDPFTATGTGIVVAPGGGFRYLAIDKEGHDAARWLASRGIAAFVLKYRVMEAPPQGADASAGRGAAASGARGARPAGRTNMDEAGRYGIADGIQAIKVVRERAAEFGISPERIGILGFSAGAMVTTGTLLSGDASARPDFAAPIYGGPFGEMPAIPDGLPPVFLAWAQDDALAGSAAGGFYEALKAAGYSPELHIFSAGGHGFGMEKKGTSSDHWIELFYYWLEAQGLTKPAQ